VHRAGDEPLEAIAALWARNRQRYGISVDRTAAYLKWRIDDDPHLQHEYLTMSGSTGVLGYAAYFIQHGALHVVDVVVDGARTDLARHLFAAVAHRGRELAVERVQCLTLRRSRLLPRLLRSAGFIDLTVLSPAGYRKSLQPRQFFLYIPEELRTDSRVAAPAAWYVTELFLEGLPRRPAPA